MGNLFVHDRRLQLLAITVMFAPVPIGLLLHGGQQVLPYTVSVVVFLFYCAAQHKTLHQLYNQQLSDNYDLAVAAYHDSLTGLPNRLYMDDVLERSLQDAAARGLRLALLYIDLDGFKRINDQHSHRVGDLFLREVASRMRHCLRDEDVIARIGGDEFTVLLPDCTSEHDAVRLAQRILLGAREPVLLEDKALRYSASIGISLFPTSATTLDLLIRSADEAMYAAKAAGKNRICLALAGAGREILLPEAFTPALV